jgi:hypothetical protein
MAAAMTWAQGAEAAKDPPKFYKLDLVVKEVEAGKVLTSKNYSVIISNTNKTEIRAGSKVPVGGPTTYHMVDIGTNFDCVSVKEANDELSFYLVAEVSSLLQETDPNPVIRQNRWNSVVVVPLKKPTVVFSSDDNTTKRVLQVEVTATPRL